MYGSTLRGKEGYGEEEGEGELQESCYNNTQFKGTVCDQDWSSNRSGALELFSYDGDLTGSQDLRQGCRGREKPAKYYPRGAYV